MNAERESDEAGENEGTIFCAPMECEVVRLGFHLDSSEAASTTEYPMSLP